MRNILTIARMTFLLTSRNGALYSVILIIAAATGCIFFVAAGDNNLVNELTLRIQYSYAVAYSLLTLMVIAVSCLTVRSQLDGKQIHLLTTYPLTRRSIFLGKWLGLTCVAALAEITLLLALATCAMIYAKSFADEDIQLAKSVFGIARREVAPAMPSVESLTRNRIRQMIETGELSTDAVGKDTWNAVANAVRREHQLVGPNAEKTWTFDLGTTRSNGDTVALRYRFYAEKRRQIVRGAWKVAAPGKVESHEVTFAAYPYEFNTVRIPLSQIPASGKFTLTLQAQNESDLIFGLNTGLRVYCDDGSAVANVAKAFIIQLIHLSVAVALGITAGVAFTFSVASFFSIVLYLVSLMSGYFADVAAELTEGYRIALTDQLFALAIHSGIWFVKGLQPPEIIARVSAGISIPMGELGVAWLPAIVVYGALTALIGITILRCKELEKLPG